MRKRDRQQLIETLIKNQRLYTQEELVAALGKLGCQVTQATVSRDMRELGMQKGIGPDGLVRYIISPAQSKRDPEEVLARVLRDSGATAQNAQNLVVVRSEPGTAPNVGRAVDELGYEDVVGSVAGDDTLLIVLPDSAGAKKMAGYLQSLV